tara:strand:+ start:1295 stop:1684 length:390 start_codon:yes stop_codon:yes gene_type:complete
MPRKKKQQIKTNNTDSLEGLLQETYNDACANITAAQNNINEMGNAAEPEDVDDLTKIAAQKTSALKIKDSAMRIKLEIAKLQSDLIKNKGTKETDQSGNGGKVSLSDFKAVRKMMEENSKDNEIDETND